MRCVCLSAVLLLSGTVLGMCPAAAEAPPFPNVRAFDFEAYLRETRTGVS